MEAEPAIELVREGREALSAADWALARSCFEQACALFETAEAIDGLAVIKATAADTGGQVTILEISWCRVPSP